MQNLEILLKRYYKQILVVIFITALLLRWLYLPKNAISFAYDQGRDAFIVQEILKGDIKILGPSVSGIPGLYHGVFYYYVIALPYLIGQGDPVYVAYFLSFVNSLVVFGVFYLTFLLTRKYTPSLISALIFAFSFEASQYANLLTNASMGVWFVPIVYISILIGSPILLGLSFGLAVQSELALLYHFIPIVLLTYKRFTLKKYIITFFAFIIAVLPMILSELKFGFAGVKGIFYLLGGQDGISNTKTLSDYFNTLINQSGLTFAYTIFPSNIVLGGILGFSMVFFALKTKSYWAKFLSIYIFAYALALPFGGWNMKHILVGVAPAICVLAGMSIYTYFRNIKAVLILFVIIICLSNLSKILQENINGQTIFPLQGDLVLSKELDLIDYSYLKSDRKDFSISTLTSPLYVNTLWSYLYFWYGQKEYGYVPNFLGRDQIGQVGNVLTLSDKSEAKHFYIEEPTYGIPEIYVQYARGDEESYSTLVSVKKYGQLRIEERSYLK